MHAKSQRVYVKVAAHTQWGINSISFYFSLFRRWGHKSYMSLSHHCYMDHLLASWPNQRPPKCLGFWFQNPIYLFLCPNAITLIGFPLQNLQEDHFMIHSRKFNNFLNLFQMGGCSKRWTFRHKMENYKINDILFVSSQN